MLHPVSWYNLWTFIRRCGIRSGSLAYNFFYKRLRTQLAGCDAYSALYRSGWRGTLDAPSRPLPLNNYLTELAGTSIFEQQCRAYALLRTSLQLRATIGRRIFAVLYHNLGMDGDCTQPILANVGLAGATFTARSHFPSAHAGGSAAI